jgi:hypothetical protein
VGPIVTSNLIVQGERREWRWHREHCRSSCAGDHGDLHLSLIASPLGAPALGLLIGGGRGAPFGGYVARGSARSICRWSESC